MSSKLPLKPKPRSGEGAPVPGQRLIVYEGEGDRAFFKALIAGRSLQNFRLYKRPSKMLEGVGSFEQILKSVTAGTDYENCSLVVIVADNDAEPEKSFRGIIRQIKAARRFAIPQKPREVANAGQQMAVSVLMLPWDDVPGDLETVCFEAAARAHRKIAACVEAYVQCVGAKQWGVSQISKLRLRCLIAASCRKDPNTGLQYAWEAQGGRRPKNLIPLGRNGGYVGRIVKYLRELP